MSSFSSKIAENNRKSDRLKPIFLLHLLISQGVAFTLKILQLFSKTQLQS